MKIYVAHSNSFNYKRDLYKPLRDSSLNNKYEFTLPYEKEDKPFNSKAFLDKCDLLLAEVSYPSTGLGMELGWADVKKVPIICIYKSGSKLSRSLKVVCSQFVEYKNPKEMIEKIAELIEENRLLNKNQTT